MKRVISSAESTNKSSYDEAYGSTRDLYNTSARIYDMLYQTNRHLEQYSYEDSDELKINGLLENVVQKLHSISDHYFKVMYDSKI